MIQATGPSNAPHAAALVSGPLVSRKPYCVQNAVSLPRQERSAGRVAAQPHRAAAVTHHHAGVRFGRYQRSLTTAARGWRRLQCTHSEGT